MQVKNLCSVGTRVFEILRDHIAGRPVLEETLVSWDALGEVYGAHASA